MPNPPFFSSSTVTIRPRLGLAVLGLLLMLSHSRALADPILDKADGLLKSGRADAASAIYMQYLRLHPTALPAELAMAQIAMRQSEFERARVILEQALAQHPESADTAAMLGRLYQRQMNSPAGKTLDNSRDYRALAQEHFRQALALGPNKPLVLTYLAEWQIAQNDLVTADKNLQKALQLNPGFVPALQGQVRYYIKVRELSRAKDAALHATELDPNNAENYFLIAQLMALASRPAEAVQYAEKSEQLDYGRLPERDYFLASQYERLGQLEKAVQYYENLTIYTPREATVWLKLGDLYDRINQPAKSLAAYRQAQALQPDILDQLYTQARENTRAERADVALAQWRRLIALQPNRMDYADEVYGDIAGLHGLWNFYHPQQTSKNADRDLELLEDSLENAPDNDNRRMDVVKIQIALHHGVTPDLRQTLTVLSGSKDPAVAGEAYFLLGDYRQAQEQWEDVDGKSAQEYTRLGDRLLLDQELNFSKVFYQRAYELSPSPSLQAAMKRIQAKQALAEQKLQEGNLAFNKKDYTGAVAKYQEATRIYRQWDNVYLRLADAYQQLHQWRDAKDAFDNAIALSPSLMDSQGFAKNYNKLKKKVASKASK